MMNPAADPPPGADPAATLRLYPHGPNRQMLWFALTLVLVSIVIVTLAEPGQGRMLALAALLGALGLSGYALWRFFNPGRPLLVLSPEGLFMEISGKGVFDIPWSAVRDVSTLAVASRSYAARQQFRASLTEVTAIEVSPDFFEAQIKVKPAFERAQGYAVTFVARDDAVQIALHHLLLDVPFEVLFAAIETRWRAFRHPGASG